MFSADDRLKNIDGQSLREVMRNIPSPVAVVTATTGSECRGMTAGSFTSVSLSPPLICFNVAKEARMHGILTDSSVFAVQMLRANQEDLSTHFARSDLNEKEQFEGIAHHRDDSGLPVLDDVLAVLICKPWSQYDAGDHSIFVGEVIAAAGDDPGLPLVYFQRAYHTIDAKK